MNLNENTINDTDTPLCIDCKYHKPCKFLWIFRQPEWDECTHPKTNWNDSHLDPITGKMTKPTIIKFCTVQRTSLSGTHPVCEPSGKWFEPK